MPLAGAYLFLLGLASGLALLTLSAYRRVSPRWLRSLLFALGLLVIGRYLTLALFTQPDAPQRFWPLRHLWFGTSVGLTIPSVFAVDQLIRHPAMTPKKLLQWFSPFLAVYGAVMLLAPLRPAFDPVAGWSLRLSGGWQALLSAVQGVFVVGFVGACALFFKKIPSAPIRVSLVWLAAAQVSLALDGLIPAVGGWYVRPSLYSEMLALLAIWHAYETSGRLQGL